MISYLKYGMIGLKIRNRKSEIRNAGRIGFKRVFPVYLRGLNF